MHGATYLVLENIASNESTYSQHDNVAFAVKLLMLFDFVIILHIIKNIMGITNMLCLSLQQKSQDILNVMHLVSKTKTLILKLRNDGQETILEEVTSFCKYKILRFIIWMLVFLM
jgi:hypothetical protein